MAISVADNFSYQGTKPLDSRVSFDTVAAMAAASDATLYDGCFAYVKATQKYYSYDSTNESDPTTGKWREFSGGSGGGQVESILKVGNSATGNFNYQSGGYLSATYATPFPDSNYILAPTATRGEATLALSTKTVSGCSCYVFNTSTSTYLQSLAFRYEALWVNQSPELNPTVNVTASTTDLTPGTSPLTTGDLYVVYE